MKKVVFGFVLLAIPILLQAQDSLYDAFKKAKTYNEVIAAAEDPFNNSTNCEREQNATL